RRKAGLQKSRRRLLHRVADIVPGGKFARVFGPMTDEDAEVMEPCGGIDHVVVVGEARADQPGQRVQPRLMSQFVDWQRLAAHILGQPYTKVAARSGSVCSFA